MIKNAVVLSVNPGEDVLVDYNRGKEIYNGYMKGNADYSRPFTIIFPNRVMRVDKQFVHGLFDELIIKYANNLESLKTRVNIRSNNRYLSAAIKNYIFEQ